GPDLGDALVVGRDVLGGPVQELQGLLGLAHRLVHVDVGELLVGDLDEAHALFLLLGLAGGLGGVGGAGEELGQRLLGQAEFVLHVLLDPGVLGVLLVLLRGVGVVAVALGHEGALVG